MNPWMRAGALAVALGAGPVAAQTQAQATSAPAPGLQAPPPSLQMPHDAATSAPATRRGAALPAQPPPQWRPGTSASAPSNQAAATAVLPVEERLAMLEAALAKANARLAELETRMRTHTHKVNQVSVGLLVERLNGRDVPLAISPRWSEGATGPALP